MQRLGGWARIGIVLSVLWSAYAFSYTVSSINQSVGDAGTRAYDLCLRTHHDLKIDCMDAVHDAEDKVYRENWSISTTWLALGVLPIPFAWLFVMGIVGTIKWIRRGFMSEANSNLPQGDNPH